ncbi:hypothetical protein, partial [Serratia marcescens]|uniref:hypothetical protein n=1 Tax=Serratia marcescens TaxID=615 RepID=UPI0029D8445B
DRLDHVHAGGGGGFAFRFDVGRDVGHSTILVIPAQAGIQTRKADEDKQPQRRWIPASAGLTNLGKPMTDTPNTSPV